MLEYRIDVQNADEKLKELKAELAALESRLEVTSQTIVITEACGTDEDGDTIYKEVELNNPECCALLNQIAAVEAKIAELTA